MLVQHFTIIQHKHLFVNDECEAFWVNEGLNPSEAEDLALIPVIAMTLSVQGLGMYHQRFFKHDDKISLAKFFYEAWSSSPFLKGVPDQLCIDRELLSTVPLMDILKQIDPRGKIERIVTDAGRAFATSKIQAHNQSVIYWEEYETENKPASVNDLLKLIGDKVCERQFAIASAPPIESKKLSFEQHWALTHYSPTLPLTRDAYFRLDTNWVTKSSTKVPAPGIGQAYYFSEENDDQRWIHWLYLLENEGEPGIEERVDLLDDQGEDRSYWTPKVDGLVATINTLAYPISTILPGYHLPNEVERFIRYGEPLSPSKMQVLLKAIDTSPLIIFPKTAQQCSAAFEHNSRGGCRTVFELVGGKHSSYIYRIFACNPNTASVFLIAIKADSRANSPSLEEVFSCTVNQFDVGQSGFSALSYWIELVSELQIKDICGLVINMVERMLFTASDGRETLL